MYESLSTVVIDGAEWYYATQVCEAFGFYRYVHYKLAEIPPGHFQMHNSRQIISIPAVIELAFRSKKSGAHQFGYVLLERLIAENRELAELKEDKETLENLMAENKELKEDKEMLEIDLRLLRAEMENSAQRASKLSADANTGANAESSARRPSNSRRPSRSRTVARTPVAEIETEAEIEAETENEYEYTPPMPSAKSAKSQIDHKAEIERFGREAMEYYERTSQGERRK